jgi:hypothetical protein
MAPTLFRSVLRVFFIASVTVTLEWAYSFHHSIPGIHLTAFS